MSDNETKQINEPQVPENDLNANVPSKKTFRIGYFFFSLLALAAVFVIQTVAEVPFLVLSFIDAAKEVPDLDSWVLIDKALEIFSDKYMMAIYLAYSLLGLIVFGIWYYKGFVKKNPKVKIGQVFGVKSVLAAVFGVLSVSLAIDAVLTAIYIFAPHVLDSYLELMKEAGFTDYNFIILTYMLFLGPLLEELFARGVVFGFLEKAGFKPFWVMFISSVFFGIIHLNLVQGIYAACFGMFLAFLRYKYRSIMISVLGHIVFNILGVTEEMLLEKIGVGDTGLMIIGAVSLIGIVIAVIVVNGDKKTLGTSCDN